MADTFRESTNATQYQQKQRLPPNFSTVLKEYTREVLRVQPDDILEWSATYFKALAIETDPTIAQQPPADHYAPEVEDPEQEVLAMNMARVFQQMDEEGSGSLYLFMVKRAFLESFGLSRQQALYVLSSQFVEIDDEAKVPYRDVARHAVPATTYFQQTQQEFPALRHADPENPTVHGMTREELEGVLTRAAGEVDEDDLGKISIKGYKGVLESAPLDLTRRDIKVLLAESEVTRGGSVDIRLEVGRAFDLLLLSGAFSAFDEENEG